MASYSTTLSRVSRDDLVLDDVVPSFSIYHGSLWWPLKFSLMLSLTWAAVEGSVYQNIPNQLVDLVKPNQKIGYQIINY